MINREATIRWKGYDPDELSPKSGKRVWANCDRCGKGRWVSKDQYFDLCFKCANSLPKPKFVPEEDRFIFGTRIDRIKTIEEKGYDPIDLKPKSSRKVWSICQNCEEGRLVQYRYFDGLCYSCAAKKKVDTREKRKKISDGVKRANENDPSIRKNNSILSKIRWSDITECKLQSDRIKIAFEKNPSLAENLSQSQKRRFADPMERIKLSAHQQGISIEDWTGFSSIESNRIYNSAEYKKWRNAVLLRDNYTCQITGQKINLNVHHIFPRRDYPELSFNVENGITINREFHESICNKEYEYLFMFIRILAENNLVI